MFSYNAGIRPESYQIFCPVRQLVVPVGLQITLFGRDCQVAEPGTKSTISNCTLLSLFSLCAGETAGKYG